MAALAIRPATSLDRAVLMEDGLAVQCHSQMAISVADFPNAADPGIDMHRIQNVAICRQQ